MATAVSGSWSRQLLVCGVGTGVLHATVYLTQRAIHHGPGAAGQLPFAVMLAGYTLATCGLFALYGIVVRAVGRERIGTRSGRRLVILIPVLFNLALMPTLPSLSIDIYSYLARGYLQAALGQNPYLVPARAVAGTPFARELAEYGWQAVHPVSPYGPIVSHMDHAVAAATRSVRLQILLLKAFAVTALLGSAAVIWVILGRVRPDQQLLGTVVFLWNPMVTWELAGEGHNDAVMILFTLLAMALILRERPTAGITMMSLAVLTKYLPVLLVPLSATYAWRSMRAPRRSLIMRSVLGAVIATTVTMALFLPLWAGLDTFRGVRINGAPGSTGSTPTVVLEALQRVAPGTEWHDVVWGVIMVSLLICVVAQARRVIDAGGLLRAAAVVWLLWLLLFCPTYWPWYATTVVALLALVPEPRFVALAFVVSISARLAAPLTMLYVHQLISRPLFLGSVWIIGVAVPLTVMALLGLLPARARSLFASWPLGGGASQRLGVDSSRD
jgi:alpha-1,6-mannosyltransferase